MTSSSERPVDAIVVGGNLAGLFCAYTLATWGFRTRLIEKSAEVGGMDRSFANRLGTLFDFGVHALAYRRSELVTRLFQDVLGGRVRRVDVRRGIVLRGHVIPYQAKASEWPEELQKLLAPGLTRTEIVDDLGDDLPTRERLGRIYGPAFADFIFDEVLVSYPSECRHLDFGVPEHELLTNLYPWFFPRARGPENEGGAAPRFQDRIRRGELSEQILYPEAGSFGVFPEALYQRLLEMGVEVVAGADDLRLDFETPSRRVAAVQAGGRRHRADRVYWCGSPAELYRQMGFPVPDLVPDRFVLSSLEFEKPVRGDWTELLVADPEHRIDRISFRGQLAGIPNRLVQLEFAYPRENADFEAKDSAWLESAMRSLVRLGVLQEDNRLLDFDLKIVPMLYNAFGVEGQKMPEPRFDLPQGSNLRPVLPSLKKININTRLPQYIRFLADDLG